MCSCVLGEVLRHCSAANPVDIIILAVRTHSVMTVLSLKEKSRFIFHAHITLKSLILLFVRLCVYCTSVIQGINGASLKEHWAVQRNQVYKQQYQQNCHPYFSTVWTTEVWMTIFESGWNLWVWLVGVVSRRWVWLVGGIYGYGYHV